MYVNIFENITILGFSGHDRIDTFAEMWYDVFFWCLFSSIVVHSVAAAIAFGRLKSHPSGRFIAGLIFIMGVLSPATGGVITSAAIAGVYRASGFSNVNEHPLIDERSPFIAMFFGVGQTLLVIFVSFTRILPTL